MTTIGVGQALRKQQRAADAQRRPRREGRATEHLPDVDMGRATCTACGIDHPASSGMQSEDGAICMACFTRAEADVVPTHSRFWDLAPLALSGLSIALMGVNVAGADATTFAGEGGMGWPLLTMLGVLFGTLAVFHGARLVREAFRSRRVEEGSPVDRLTLAVGGASSLGGLIFAGTSIGLFARPYLGLL